MTLEDVLRWVHVIAGGAALLIGPATLRAPKRIGVHSRLGEVFFVMATFVCLSGGTLAVMYWESRWMFFFIALGTFAYALVGYAAGKRRWRHWLMWHVGGQGGAYTGMVTAFIVANWDNVTGTQGTDEPLVFLVPMSLGCIAGGWLLYEVHHGRRPRVPAERM